MRIKFDQDFDVNAFNNANKRFRNAKDLNEAKLAYADAKLILSDIDPERLSPKQYKIFMDMEEETESMRKVINGQPKQKCRRLQCDRFRRDETYDKDYIIDGLKLIRLIYKDIEGQWRRIIEELKTKHGMTLTEEAEYLLNNILNNNSYWLNTQLDFLQRDLSKLPTVIYTDSREPEEEDDDDMGNVSSAKRKNDIVRQILFKK